MHLVAFGLNVCWSPKQHMQQEIPFYMCTNARQQEVLSGHRAWLGACGAAEPARRHALASGHLFHKLSFSGPFLLAEFGST